MEGKKLIKNVGVDVYIGSKENGITLIALVITIIVLLILAGVTISMVVGENGILTRAKYAKEVTAKAQKKEEIETVVIGSYGINGYDVDALEKNLKNINVEGFTKQFPAYVKSGDVCFEITKEGEVKHIDIPIQSLVIDSKIGDYIDYNGKLWRLMYKEDGKASLISVDGIEDIWSSFVTELEAREWAESLSEKYYENAIIKSGGKETKEINYYDENYTESFQPTFSLEQMEISLIQGGNIQISNTGYFSKRDSIIGNETTWKDEEWNDVSNLFKTGDYVWIGTYYGLFQNEAAVWSTSVSGAIYGEWGGNGGSIRPIIHLKSNIIKTGGNGTLESPYTISYE